METAAGNSEVEPDRRCDAKLSKYDLVYRRLLFIAQSQHGYQKSRSAQEQKTEEKEEEHRDIVYTQSI